MKGKIKRIGRAFIKVTAFALLGVTAFVCGAVTNQALQKQSSYVSESIVTGNSLLAGQTTNRGISMMAANGTDYVGNTLGESVPYGALKVTATVTPATASNPKLTWSYAWTEGNSWSSGKNASDYFKIETIGGNAHEAYVWATQAFGCPITVTAMSTDGTNKSATMQVDFAKRMTGVEFQYFGNFDYANQIYHGVMEEASYQAEAPSSISFNGAYGVGTKDLTWKFVDYFIEFDQGYYMAVDAEQSFNYQPLSEWSYGYHGGWELFPYNIFPTEAAHDLFFDGDVDNAENYNKLIDCIIACDGRIGELYVEFESEETDALGNKYTYGTYFEIVIGEEWLGLMVENIALSDNAVTI